MRKIEIVTGVALVLMLCMGYLHFRSDVVAQTGTSETDVADLKRQIESFFTMLEAQSGSPDGYLNAYKMMFTGPQTQETDTLATMVQKTEEMFQTGYRWRSEILDNKSVGNDLIQIRYLYKSDTQPFVWYFTFYRSQTGTRPGDLSLATRKWNCISIRFDNDLDALFKGSLPK